MKKRRVLLISTIVLLSVVNYSMADWEPGFPALYYQLPSESGGWSINADWGAEHNSSVYRVADEWTAAQTSAITDIHFWGSWKYDAIGQTQNIYVRIFNNDSSNPEFSKPGQCVWSRLFNPNEYTAGFYDSREQNWYESQTGDWLVNDHQYMYQYSIPLIQDQFIQLTGQTYWLMITADVQGGAWGWNTAPSAVPGSAVYWDDSISGWSPIMGPAEAELAFVIVPEPATLFFLAIGSLLLQKKK